MMRTGLVGQAWARAVAGRARTGVASNVRRRIMAVSSRWRASRRHPAVLLADPALRVQSAATQKSPNGSLFSVAVVDYRWLHPTKGGA
jgi:hypothetical protein